jgi:hypothetical protein
MANFKNFVKPQLEATGDKELLKIFAHDELSSFNQILSRINEENIAKLTLKNYLRIYDTVANHLESLDNKNEVMYLWEKRCGGFYKKNTLGGLHELLKGLSTGEIELLNIARNNLEVYIPELSLMKK